MKKLPRALNENIVVQQLNNEMLIYDLKTNKAYNLNETSMIVFNSCNGKTTFDELKREHKFTDDLIFFALDELSKENLIEKPETEYFTGLTRREVIKKVGLSSMIALPVISSLIAPSAASAASGGGLPNGAACSSGTQCASTRCSVSKSGVCCNAAGNDNGSCTTTNDCCLFSHVCQTGRCCRVAGTPCGGNNSICCSGVCSTATDPNGRCT